MSSAGVRVAASSDRMVCSVPAAPLSHVLGVQPPGRALLCAPLRGLLTRRCTLQVVKGFARHGNARQTLCNWSRVSWVR